MEQDNGHNAECAIHFTCKSAFGAPQPPQVSPQLFPFHSVPFHSQGSYYHWHVPKPVPLMFISHFGSCLLLSCRSQVTVFEDKEKSKHPHLHVWTLYYQGQPFLSELSLHYKQMILQSVPVGRCVHEINNQSIPWVRGVPWAPQLHTHYLN